MQIALTFPVGFSPAFNRPLRQETTISPVWSEVRRKSPGASRLEELSMDFHFVLCYALLSVEILHFATSALRRQKMNYLTSSNSRQTATTVSLPMHWNLCHKQLRLVQINIAGGPFPTAMFFKEVTLRILNSFTVINRVSGEKQEICQ